MKLPLSMFCVATIILASQSIAHGDDDPAALIGEWRVVTLETRGKSDSGVSFRGMRYTFDKDTWTTWPGTTTPAGRRRQATNEA